MREACVFAVQTGKDRNAHALIEHYGFALRWSADGSP